MYNNKTQVQSESEWYWTSDEAYETIIRPQLLVEPVKSNKKLIFSPTFLIEHTSKQQGFALVHRNRTATAGGGEIALSGDLLPGHTGEVQAGKAAFRSC